ncbi:hypothetical protein Terro_1106 [Terriglobus roseus DSM 18391]|uniref:Uncharacterized protein n=1 Tax=Terriglobus roseus (strain DSM 18391 / NRRL B-41598 / KBS 63) TaxID=926566 RepID=I3ZDV8_TERRK|nr:hypothetical protein [Terriglobus roseus]AFL87426.1 hypothetical protein Terro_1106 [Terriglobus roseus DSM 18391]
MRYELRLHRSLAAIVSGLLIGFVVLFVYLDHRAPSAWVEASVALSLEIAAATGLVAVGIAEGILAFEFGATHRREILTYLVLGVTSVVCGLYLTLTQSSSLKTVALVVAPHALLFGVAQLRVSRHLGHHPVVRTALITWGLSEVLMALALIVVSRVSDAASAGLLAYVAAMTALQLIGFLMYKRAPQEQAV